MSFEHGYHPEYLGEYEARQDSQRRLFALSGLVLIGIFLLLYIDFGAIRPALLVFGTLPPS